MKPGRHEGPPTVGMVGAGQLARMTYQAGISLGLSVHVLGVDAADSAALVARNVHVGGPTSDAVAELAERCDALTFDHELVDARQLGRLEAAGRTIWPSVATVALAQNKLLQRQRLGALGLPVPAYRAVSSVDDLVAFGNEHGWPTVAKARRGGYDGRGVWVLGNAAAAHETFAQATGAGLELLVETFVPIERELAVLVARRPSGESVAYPVVHTVQVDGICREVLAPAPIDATLAETAEQFGLAIATEVGVVGILAVELFESGGRLIVNELAARPHNSGHYTIEGCVTSQFENHLRAVLDWPLGETALTAPAVATVNVLGGPVNADLNVNLPRALAVPGAHVHLYGKGARPGRKLGHVTVTGRHPEDVLRRAREAASILIEPSMEGANR
ncbi:MAG: 5-(carboxyamino)imidazole ribonucleotide synthase [Chloroflexi bacterium]|nr:5-(carboxyamino)imidazole ribonucleotide synthase [Chloroflexota bacterium]